MLKYLRFKREKGKKRKDTRQEAEELSVTIGMFKKNKNLATVSYGDFIGRFSKCIVKKST